VAALETLEMGGVDDSAEDCRLNSIVSPISSSLSESEPDAGTAIDASNSAAGAPPVEVARWSSAWSTPAAAAAARASTIEVPPRFGLLRRSVRHMAAALRSSTSAVAPIIDPKGWKAAERESIA